MTKLSDQWQTPQWLYEELNKEFNFDIDLCAKPANTKCVTFYYDYLNNDVFWYEYRRWYKDSIRQYAHLSLKGLVNQRSIKSAFMNPPYSNPRPFIEKAWEDSKDCKIVCLVKCDPSTKWWATFWDHGSRCIYCIYGKLRDDSYDKEYDCPECKGTGIYRGPREGCEVRFFPKRIKFDPPKGFEGKVTSSAFPCALVIMDRRVTK